MEDERRSLAVSDGESANAPEKARAPRLLDQVRACCRARYTACARSVLTWAGSRVTPAVCVCPLQSSHSAMRLDFRFGSRTEVEGVESRMSGIKCCVRPIAVVGTKSKIEQNSVIHQVRTLMVKDIVM